MKTKSEILNGKLKLDGGTGDGKRAFIIADTNDGHSDLRIEVDMDDCDKKFARAWMRRIIKCVNACEGIENPFVSESEN